MSTPLNPDLSANALLKTVIDENPNIILMKDWNGKFLIGNKALATLYGTTPDDLVGKDDGAFNPNAEQVAFYLENVREIMSQSETKIVMEESTNAKTGEKHYFQSIKKPLIAAEGERQILVIANDVTDLKNAQSKLEDSERRLNYVMEATGEGVWDWDVASGIVTHNKQWCKIVGLDDEYLSHPLEVFSELIHKQDAAAMMDRITNCMKGLSAYHSEHRMCLKDGRIIWVLDRGNVVERKPNGEPVRMVGSVVDITEHKSNEIDLAERTELLNTIFALSPDGFVSFDKDRCVSYVNPSFAAMVGMRTEQLIGLNEQSFSLALDKLCLDGSRFLGVDHLRDESSYKNGSYRQVIELALPSKRVLEVVLRLGQSSAVSQILYFRDITHEYEVDRMKSEFLSTAAHELRTPMANIYGYSELLINQDFSPEDQREFQTTIFKQSQLMASIIDELLDIARIEARRGKDFIIESVNLCDLIREVITGFRTKSGRVCRFDPEGKREFFLHVDRKKMIQTLNNVLSNAFKYSPNGGEVELELICSSDQADEQARARSMVGIRVTDQGIGMSPEQVARVFERFYRADSSGKIPGTGLGMSIVKEVVELHGGTVEIQSAPGKGTAVTLWLPYGVESDRSAGQSLNV